ncbi:anti-sigma factor [Falsibacillus pallidus]|uniref:Anti-sigma-W factor RsiW n=1 Tax=Falsibacillus pallidus TaxID=493781 RepID=A0A370GEP5_9BACI|nr:anti-sigma factor [Falsibacillus pallidus]RDI42272.1 putative zinc finger protein [Falsibacillus pallidus]
MNTNLCENLIDYFNHSLTDEETKAFEEHLKECPECREELEELIELTGDLAFQTEPITPPEGMKERVLTRVFEDDEEASSTITSPSVFENPTPLETAREKKSSKRKWLIPAMAAALFLSLGANFYLGSQMQKEPEQPKTAAIDHIVRQLALNPVDGNAAGTASFVKQNGNVSMVIQASQLKSLKSDEVYQVWLIKNDKPYRAGTFTTSDDGTGTVVYTMTDKKDQDLSQWDTVAITLEPNADSQTPKGEMVLASNL